MEVKTETPEEKEALDMIDNTPAQFVNCTAKHPNELLNTLNWFKQAIPNPTDEQKCIQMGCHFEEVGEMLESIGYVEEYVEDVSHDMKKAHKYTVEDLMRQVDDNEIELLDAMVDQIVTAVGVCHMMGFDIMSALAEVNRSNYSKFEDGKPVFDCGKISKGRFYTPPNLTPFIGNCNED